MNKIKIIVLFLSPINCLFKFTFATFHIIRVIYSAYLLEVTPIIFMEIATGPIKIRYFDEG